MRENLTGRKFGSLVVVRYSRSVPRGKHSTKVMWLCCCLCGKEHEASADNLRSGNTISCGCLQGKRVRREGTRLRSPELLAWRNMWQRCTYENGPRFKDWGGRGIRVCNRWKSYAAFLRDVGIRPTVRHSLNRFPNPDGNYEPGNVRWATLKQQRNNRRAA